ncbi:MAG: ArsR/SmtB family transcription factor [Gemmatimonadales bacterium]
MSATAAPELDRAVAIFHSLSDATRLSSHVRVLKDAELVTERKEGRWSYYTIVPEAFDEADDLVVEFVPAARVGAPSRPSGGRTNTKKSPRCCA